MSGFNQRVSGLAPVEDELIERSVPHIPGIEEAMQDAQEILQGEMLHVRSPSRLSRHRTAASSNERTPLLATDDEHDTPDIESNHTNTDQRASAPYTSNILNDSFSVLRSFARRDSVLSRSSRGTQSRYMMGGQSTLGVSAPFEEVSDVRQAVVEHMLDEDDIQEIEAHRLAIERKKQQLQAEYEQKMMLYYAEQQQKAAQLQQRILHHNQSRSAAQDDENDEQDEEFVIDAEATHHDFAQLPSLSNVNVPTSIISSQAPAQGGLHNVSEERSSEMGSSGGRPRLETQQQQQRQQQPGSDQQTAVSGLRKRSPISHSSMRQVRKRTDSTVDPNVQQVYRPLFMTDGRGTSMLDISTEQAIASALADGSILSMKSGGGVRQTVPMIPGMEPPVNEAEELRRGIQSFICELLYTLYISGLPSYAIEYFLTVACMRFDETAHFVATPVSLWLSFSGDGAEYSCRFMRILPSSRSMSKIHDVNDLALDVVQGNIGVQEGYVELRKLRNRQAIYPRWAHILALIVTIAVQPPLTGKGSIREVPATLALALAAGVVEMLRPHLRIVDRGFEFLIGLIAGAGASIAMSFFGPIYPDTVLASVLVWALPGAMLCTAVAEMSAYYYLSGTIRLMVGMVSATNLAFGVVVGFQLQLLLPQAPIPVHESAPLLWRILPAFVGGLGFAVLLDSKPKMIPWIGVAGCLTYLFTTEISVLLGQFYGPFFGTLATGIASNIYGRITSKPSLEILLPSLFFISPGALSMKAMMGVMDGTDHSTGAAIFSNLFSVLLSMGIGIIISNVLVVPHKAL
eukprot:Clim_evm1s148 gene=Clim_evmTU1s148